MNNPTPQTPQGSTSQLPTSELRRVARHLNLPGFGIQQQQRLHAAHVLVIGAGGLGCPALQQLAAVGVGTITIMDDDTVDITNIHRQILFGASDVGKPKVDIAAERIRDLQPGISIRAVRERITPANALEVLAGVDVIVDGSDTFATKFLVADAAEITSTPLAWATVLRYRGDVALWHSGTRAPDGRGVGLRDVFPMQPGGDSVPDCATAGVLGVTTSVVAGLMVTEVIAHIAGLTGAGTPGRLTSYDALNARTTTLRVSADPGRALLTQLQGSYEDTYSVPAGSSGAADSSAAREAQAQERERLMGMIRRGDAVAWDIREPHEVVLLPWPGVQPVLLPGSQIHSAADLPLPGVCAEGAARVTPGASDAPTKQGARTEAADGLSQSNEAPRTVVVACAAGVRSAAFIQRYQPQLRAQGVQLVSLPGGVNAL